MSDNNKKYIYFDDTTNILSPLLIVLAIGMIFGLVFFG